MVEKGGGGTGDVAFLIVRHGQTQYNIKHLVQGWCDSPLTDEGVHDAQRLALGLAQTKFTEAYSSDSGRAVATLDILLKPHAEAVTRKLSPSLREWCYGDFEEGPGENLHKALVSGFGKALTSEEYSLRLPEVADVLADYDRSGRAERFPAIEGRLSSFFEEAAPRVYAAGGGIVLAVTHAFAIKSIVYHYARERVVETGRIENASVTELFFDGKDFSVGAIGNVI